MKTKAQMQTPAKPERLVLVRDGARMRVVSESRLAELFLADAGQRRKARAKRN